MDLAVLAVIGRILVGAAFVVSGIHMALSLPRVAGLLESKRVPYPMYVAASGAAIEIVLGLATIIGLSTGLVAILLAIFVLAATIMVHDFWRTTGAERVQSENVWISNVMIIGGLLVLAAFG